MDMIACLFVMLLVLLSAAGMSWLLIHGFALLSRFGIDPPVVIIVLVLVGVAFSAYRAKRDGYP